MKKFFYFFSIFLIFIFIIYSSTGFYVAYKILKIDPTCGLHQNSLPNTWSTKIDAHQYNVFDQSVLRQNFPFQDYYLDEWQDVYFPSRDKNIKINGWLFNYFPNKPIVIVVHGINPNGKCKSEVNLIASLLIKEKINALTIDLRNYGQSDTVSKYEDLGLQSYKDVLGAYDFLQKIGFKSTQIGLHGISLGASTVIFSAHHEPNILAVWADSALAEFNMILKDEISRYGLSLEFGPVVSFAGKILTGIDPNKLSPAGKLSKKQSYFFTHGDKDTRILPRHFEYFKKYASENNIKSEFWLAKDSYHLDSMLKYTDEYSLKMKNFFEQNLK